MKFTIQFKTMGMTLYAGQVEAVRVDSAKPGATDLLLRRNVPPNDSGGAPFSHRVP